MKSKWVGIAVAIVWSSVCAAQGQGTQVEDVHMVVVDSPAAWVTPRAEALTRVPDWAVVVAKRQAGRRTPSGAAFEIDEDETITGGWTTVSASGDRDWVDIDRDPKRAPFARLSVPLSFQQTYARGHDEVAPGEWSAHVGTAALIALAATMHVVKGGAWPR